MSEEDRANAIEEGSERRERRVFIHLSWFFVWGYLIALAFCFCVVLFLAMKKVQQVFF